MKPEDIPQWCAVLKTELTQLRAENERLNDLLKTRKVLEYFNSYEKCAKDLAHHKQLLVERDRVLGVALEALKGVSLVEWDEENACYRWMQMRQYATDAVSQINKVLEVPK